MKKDIGAWSIPKGEFTDEPPLDAAKRELEEETGIKITVNDEELKPLTPVKLKSGKIVHAWAVEQDADEAMIKSNVFNLEWPQKSGKTIVVPEVDKAGWFTAKEAKQKLNEFQAAFIDEASGLLGRS